MEVQQTQAHVEYPLWITLHGLPGSGKSTLINALIDRDDFVCRPFYILGDRLLTKERVVNLLSNMNRESIPCQLDAMSVYESQLDGLPSPKMHPNMIVLEHTPADMIHNFTFAHMYWSKTMSLEAQKWLSTREGDLQKKREAQLNNGFVHLDIWLNCPLRTAVANLKKRDPDVYSTQTIKDKATGKHRIPTFYHLLESIDNTLLSERWNVNRVTVPYTHNHTPTERVLDEVKKLVQYRRDQEGPRAFRIFYNGEFPPSTGAQPMKDTSGHPVNDG